MKRGAKFSPDRKHRLILYRIWKKPLETKRFILFVGLNPSTADGKEDDRTITRLIQFAKDWGYNGFYITNLFTFVSTDSSVLKKMMPKELNHRSADKIMRAAADTCVSACYMWGAKGKLYARNLEVSTIVGAQSRLGTFTDIFCFKMGKNGMPVHPLYLPKDTKPQPYYRRSKAIDLLDSGVSDVQSGRFSSIGPTLQQIPKSK